jgi:hypothetical protein
MKSLQRSFRNTLIRLWVWTIYAAFALLALHFLFVTLTMLLGWTDSE